MAQIYVDSGLDKPKSIHIFNSSAQIWEGERIGYVRVSGVWVPFIEYSRVLYDNGIENVYWTPTAWQGASVKLEKKIDSLHLYAREFNQFQAYFTVRESINITKFNKLYVDCQNLGTVNTGIQLRIKALIPGSSPGSSSNSFAELLQTSRFERKILELDISSVTGEVDVAIHIAKGVLSSTMEAAVSVFKVWLE